MNFDLTDVQRAWRDKAAALGRALSPDASAADVVLDAAEAGLLDPAIDLLSVVVAVEALAAELPSAGASLALHSAAALSLGAGSGSESLYRGETVAALTIATDHMPEMKSGVLTGTASWVAPITASGVALIGVRGESALEAALVRLDDPSVTVEEIPTAALRGLVCGNLTLRNTPCRLVGEPMPVMSRARILTAAVGLGIGRRAVREAVRQSARHEQRRWRGTKRSGACRRRRYRHRCGDAAHMESREPASLPGRRVDGEAGRDRGRPAGGGARDAGCRC